MLQENLLFFVLSTTFFLLAGWYWRNAKPYSLPESRPSWFKFWFLSVQILGGLVPLIALIIWGLLWTNPTVIAVFASYLLMLGLQIFAEFLSLRYLATVVWVMIPYLYVPYRVWQLYEGLNLLENTSELMAVQIILILNIGVWIVNYCLDLAQLPFLFYWETKEVSGESS